MEIKPENLLSVSVGRVASRKEDVSSFVSPEEYYQYFNLVSIEQQPLPDHLKDDWLFVPTPFANVYLGEMFSFYVKCTNDSIQDIMSDVTVRIDMQIGNNAIFLKELKTDKLDAKSVIDTVLSYEIKDQSNHLLICTLAFNIANYDRQTNRQFFNFQISKPFDVKTKFEYINKCEEVYMEALFQNLTNLPIQMRSVNFESTNFDVNSLNYVMNNANQWIFGEKNRLNPMESRQYLYLLKPKKEIRFDANALNSITAFGKLDIVWVSGIGEKGRIQTYQLEKTATTCDKIKIFIEEIPTNADFKKIFKLKFRLINCSSDTIEPILNFINNENQSIFWLGISSKNLGKIEKSQSVQLEMPLYPTKQGLNCIPILKVTDLITNNNQEYKELAFINII